MHPNHALHRLSPMARLKAALLAATLIDPTAFAMFEEADAVLADGEDPELAKRLREAIAIDAKTTRLAKASVRATIGLPINYDATADLEETRNLPLDNTEAAELAEMVKDLVERMKSPVVYATPLEYWKVLFAACEEHWEVVELSDFDRLNKFDFSDTIATEIKERFLAIQTHQVVGELERLEKRMKFGLTLYGADAARAKALTLVNDATELPPEITAAIVKRIEEIK